MFNKNTIWMMARIIATTLSLGLFIYGLWCTYAGIFAKHYCVSDFCKLKTSQDIVVGVCYIIISIAITAILKNWSNDQFFTTIQSPRRHPRNFFFLICQIHSNNPLVHNYVQQLRHSNNMPAVCYFHYNTFSHTHKDFFHNPLFL